MNLKVGDKVRVKTYENRPVRWNMDGEMDKYMGQIVTISSFDGPSVLIEEAKGENGGGLGWRFWPEDFEPVCRFKAGDRVVGNKKARQYSITTEGVVGTVVEVYSEKRISFKPDDCKTSGFTVDADCFDFADKEKLFEVYTEGGKVVVHDLKRDKKFEDDVGDDSIKTAIALIKKANVEMKYFNGRVVCIKSTADRWTQGKIYEVKDGTIIADDADAYTGMLSVDDLNLRLSAEFIAIVE